MLSILYDSLYTPRHVARPGVLLIDTGRIVSLEDALPAPSPGAEVIDARGFHVVPGLIDLQLNGAFGLDFTANPDDIWAVAGQITRFGVTTFLPTIITSPPGTVGRGQAVVMQGPPPGFKGAAAPGLHIEGPFLSEARKGAHNPDYFRRPSLAEVARWTPAEGIRLVTLAPELPGVLEVISWLAAQGVVVSAGHSSASYDEALRGFDAGIRCGTHLFNAMSGLNHREPGLVGALLATPGITVGLIPDGVHVHPAAVGMAWQIKGSAGLTPVSDAMAALGMPPGTYQLAGFAVTVDETSARLADGTLAGSILAPNAALRNLVRFTGCSLAEAVAAMTGTPAGLLGLERKGRLSPGCDADITILDSELNVVMTLVGGQVVWSTGQPATPARP